MRIKVNNIEINCWEDGYPYWFHIQQGDSMISFTEREAPAISDALRNLVKHIDNIQSEKRRLHES